LSGLCGNAAKLRIDSRAESCYCPGPMKFVRLILLIIFGLFVLYVKVKTGGTNGGGMSDQPAGTAPSASSTTPVSSPVSNSEVPDKAVKVLQYVRQNGRAPEGYVGGRTFENREGRLQPGGDYREFDVDPHNGQRNAERLIIEWNTKKAWYTGDHYQTFIPVP
jgi:ribonuclease T1